MKNCTFSHLYFCFPRNFSIVDCLREEISLKKSRKIGCGNLKSVVLTGVGVVLSGEKVYCKYINESGIQESVILTLSLRLVGIATTKIRHPKLQWQKYLQPKNPIIQDDPNPYMFLLYIFYYTQTSKVFKLQ